MGICARREIHYTSIRTSLTRRREQRNEKAIGKPFGGERLRHRDDRRREYVGTVQRHCDFELYVLLVHDYRHRFYLYVLAGRRRERHGRWLYGHLHEQPALYVRLANRHRRRDSPGSRDHHGNG